MESAKVGLLELRAALVVVNVIADAAPGFAPLTTDAEMQKILERRWIECTKCVTVKAHLAAIVMMGGFEKERRHGVSLEEHDSAILWGLTKSLVAQLLVAKP